MPRSARVFQVVAGAIGGTLALAGAIWVAIDPSVLSVLMQGRPPAPGDQAAVLAFLGFCLIPTYGIAAWTYYKYLRRRQRADTRTTPGE